VDECSQFVERPMPLVRRDAQISPGKSKSNAESDLAFPPTAQAMLSNALRKESDEINDCRRALCIIFLVADVPQTSRAEEIVPWRRPFVTIPAGGSRRQGNGTGLCLTPLLNLGPGVACNSLCGRRAFLTGSFEDRVRDRVERAVEARWGRWFPASIRLRCRRSAGTLEIAGGSGAA